MDKATISRRHRPWTRPHDAHGRRLRAGGGYLRATDRGDRQAEEGRRRGSRL